MAENTHQTVSIRFFVGYCVSRESKIPLFLTFWNRKTAGFMNCMALVSPYLESSVRRRWSKSPRNFEHIQTRRKSSLGGRNTGLFISKSANALEKNNIRQFQTCFPHLGLTHLIWSLLVMQVTPIHFHYHKCTPCFVSQCKCFITICMKSVFCSVSTWPKPSEPISGQCWCHTKY